MNAESTLSEIQKEVWKVAEEKGWHSTGRTFVEELCLLHSEISEALEDFRNGRSVTEVYYEGKKPCGIPIELAGDLMIRNMDICMSHGILVASPLLIKHEYNKTRPFRHGGKKL